ncbi:DeoR/GlpR family DNA-binding transcription regulator [Microbacterium sp. NPDC091313]
MYAMERQELVERLLQDEGRVSVVDLARRFEVTTETIRRDLDRLEEAGRLRRVHGGAVALDRGSTAEPTLAERLQRRGDAKTAIAARALRALGSGFRGSVYIDAGTTTAALAERLPAYLDAANGRAEVVTHSMSIAAGLAGDAAVSLSVIGGRVRGVTAAAVGAHTLQSISELRPDVAFVGTNGLSAGFGLSTPDPEEAAVKTAIVRAARRVVVLADATKFGEELLVRFAGLAEIDTLVSDAAPPVALETALADADVEVVRA